jgi:hypothetical protein
VLKKGEVFELDGTIHYRYRHWCTEVSEESSNYRELLNLVEGLEIQVREGGLRECEVFLFTDNSTAEAVYFKGNSTSRKLFELVLRLRRLEMSGGLILHVVHVAGTRMIDQGADGGSRGDLNQGSMAGESVLDFVPLHLSALERSSKVEDWVRSWWNKKLGKLQTLSPEGWFDDGQQEGCFLWAPPPAAAEVVAELLGEARHKRPNCTHITIVPRLMKGRWRRALGKEADLITEIPAGVSFWKENMHEPLTLLVSLPLCHCRPWALRKTPLLEGLDRELRQVWKTSEERGRSLLRELLVLSGSFPSMPEGMVRRVLYSTNWKSAPNSDPS